MTPITPTCMQLKLTESSMQVTAYGIIAQNCQTGDLTSNVQFYAPPGSEEDSQDEVGPNQHFAPCSCQCRRSLWREAAQRPAHRGHLRCRNRLEALKHVC